MYIEVRDAVKPSRELLPFPPTSRISTRLRGRRHHRAQEQWGKRKLALDEETGEGFTEKGTLRGSQRLVRTCGVEEKKHTHEKGERREDENWAWKGARQGVLGPDSLAVCRVPGKGENESIGKVLPR